MKNYKAYAIRLSMPNIPDISLWEVVGLLEDMTPEKLMLVEMNGFKYKQDAEKALKDYVARIDNHMYYYACDPASGALIIP